MSKLEKKLSAAFEFLGPFELPSFFTAHIDTPNGDAEFVGTLTFLKHFPDLPSTSGVATGTTADKLVDSAQTFETKLITPADDIVIVYNVTDGTYATVSATDSQTTLSLDNDIMVTGDSYEVYHVRKCEGVGEITAPATLDGTNRDAGSKFLVGFLDGDYTSGDTRVRLSWGLNK